MAVFGFEIPVGAIGLIALFFVIYLTPIVWLHGKRALRYLEFAGIPIVPGARLFVGHILQMLKAEHLGKYDYLQMKKYGSVFGLCEFSLPVFVISDPDILKEVLVRQFSSFTDRRRLPMRGLMKFSMFDQRGAEWKRLRTMMTPFFSTVKIKQNFGNMNCAADTLVDILKGYCEKHECFDAEKICHAFSMDVIFASAFGIQLDSQRNPNDPFLTTVLQLTNVSLNSPLLFLAFTFPSMSALFEKLGITMFPSGYLEFFKKAITKMINERLNGDEQAQAADFITTMVRAHRMEEMESELKRSAESQGTDAPRQGLTDLEIAAQCLLFVLAGWGTTATTMSFLLHNLAVHQQFQDRVVSELNDVIRTEGGLTYESISKLEFLDQCLCESLRVYPPAFRFDREADSDVTIRELKIPRGSSVVVPVWALNHDEKHWPDPERFDPDRFSPEARDAINEYVYMPFGAGLRSCIGNRFSQIEIKLGVARVLREFRLVAASNTKDPVELQSGLFVQPKNGLPLAIERR